MKHPLGKDGTVDFTQRKKADDQRTLAMAWPIEFDPELVDDRYSYRVRVADLWFEIRLFVDARPAKASGVAACCWLVVVALLDHRWQPVPSTRWDRGHVITLERVARSQIEQCGDASHEMTAIAAASFSLMRRLAKPEADELAATLERLNG